MTKRRIVEDTSETCREMQPSMRHSKCGDWTIQGGKHLLLRCFLSTFPINNRANV